MPTYGLVPTGFNVKPAAAILTDIQTAELAGISPALDLQPPDPLAVATGIVMQALAELWLGLGALYNGMDPDQAAGDQLQSLALLTGTDREPASSTQVPGCTVNVNAGFSAAIGTMFASITGNPGAIFTNKEAVLNSGGSPSDETVDFQAVNTGPQACLAGTLVVIASPLSGWNTITNPNDGVPGANIESDPALRLRRVEELQTAGESTADAIKADVFAASQAGKFSSQVKSCTVYFNDTDTVDANGIPGHSIEVVCYQPGYTSADDQALADLIFLQAKGAGIGTWGNTHKTSTDGEGFSEVIYFTRPEEVAIYVALTIVVNGDYPADGDTEVKTAIATFGNGIGVGSTVYWKHVAAQQWIAGVVDDTSFAIGTAPSPVSAANIVLTFRQIATFDTANIAVTS